MDKVYVIGATQIVLGILGASVFPTKIAAPAGCAGMQMKLLSAAGSTVQILPNAVAGATIAGATAVINGYPLVSTEMSTVLGPANFYLGCTGASAIVAMNFLFTAGGATLT